MNEERKKDCRLNLRISQKQAERLRQLTELTDAASMTEVIAKALAVYDHLLKAKEEGKEIIVRDAGRGNSPGSEQNLVLL